MLYVLLPPENKGHGPKSTQPDMRLVTAIEGKLTTIFTDAAPGSRQENNDSKCNLVVACSPASTTGRASKVIQLDIPKQAIEFLAQQALRNDGILDLSTEEKQDAIRELFEAGELPNKAYQFYGQPAVSGLPPHMQDDAQKSSPSP